MSTEFLIRLLGIFAGVLAFGFGWNVLVLEGEAWAGSVKDIQTPRSGGEN